MRTFTKLFYSTGGIPYLWGRNKKGVNLFVLIGRTMKNRQTK